MASKENRTGDIRVYVISGLLFLCIFAGGAFLGMYITLPESQSAVWYPVAGIILVCIPWLFWLLTFTKAASTTNSAAPATASAEPPIAGRVKFGATTVLGEEDDQDGHTVETRGKEEEESNGGSSASSSDMSNDQSFSVKSHESELPLTLSMSS